MNLFNFYAPIYDHFMKLFKLYRPELIIKYLEPKSSDTVLDLGGGTGFISNQISQYVDKVVLLDDSLEMLKKAERYNDLEICHAKAPVIPYADNYFDSVICIDALHHIKDIDATLKEINRVCKKNGRVVILEFHITGVMGKLFWLFEKIYIDNSEFIKPDQLNKKLSDLNFEGNTINISEIQYIYRGIKK